MGEIVAQKTSLLISRASTAWKFMHGLMNVYKPAGMETSYVIKAIKTNICKGTINHSFLPISLMKTDEVEIFMVFYGNLKMQIVCQSNVKKRY